MPRRPRISSRAEGSHPRADIAASPRSARVGTPGTDDPLRNRRVLVTGGGTGMGLAIARLLHAGGAQVAILGRTRDEVTQGVRAILTNAEGAEITRDRARARRPDARPDGPTAGRAQQGGSTSVLGIVADTSKERDVARAFSEMDKVFGGIDILVNNAAVHEDAIDDTPIAAARRLLHVNVLGYIACARQAVDRMKRQKSGFILNIGSISACVREPGAEVYIASKAAVEAFTEALGKTARALGIRTAVIEPAGVATPMMHDVGGGSRAQLQRKVAEHRLLSPEDIARCARYILSQPEGCEVSTVHIRPTAG